MGESLRSTSKSSSASPPARWSPCSNLPSLVTDSPLSTPSFKSLLGPAADRVISPNQFYSPPFAPFLDRSSRFIRIRSNSLTDRSLSLPLGSQDSSSNGWTNDVFCNRSEDGRSRMKEPNSVGVRENEQDETWKRRFWSSGRGRGGQRLQNAR